MAIGQKWLKILELTLPRIEDYCKRTNQDLFLIKTGDEDPIQYAKLKIGEFMISKKHLRTLPWVRGYEYKIDEENAYDQITFFDCDILITKDCENIIEKADNEFDFLASDEGKYFDDRAMGVECLGKTFGKKITPKFYYNTGVFVIRKGAIGVLSQPPPKLFPNVFGEQAWLNMQLHLWEAKTSNLNVLYNCTHHLEKKLGIDKYKEAFIIHYAGQTADFNRLIESIKLDDEKLKLLGR